VKRGKLNVLIDGQWGSTGKGKIAAYLANKFRIDLAISNNMSNAGHTFYVDGRKYVAFHVPAAVARPDCEVLLGPTTAITLDLFEKELDCMERLNVRKRMSIHPHATIITERHREIEAGSVERISSTVKGCGAALAEKVSRSKNVRLAGEVKELRPYIADTVEILHTALENGAICLAEVAQGFDLSLNHGMQYPFVTSRDVTVCSCLNDCGVPPAALGDVYASLRCHPIRVGNVVREGKTVGWSGPHYPDQEELSWDTVTRQSGSEKPLIERTTVTDKVRRVFSWSDIQYNKFVKMCDPDFVFLNFINYLDADLYGVSSDDESGMQRVLDSEKVVEWLDRHSKGNPNWVPVAYVGTGPDERHMVDMGIDDIR